MTGQCRWCKFAIPDASYKKTFCGRYPPQVFLEPDGSDTTLWPRVELNDVCGEYKRDPLADTSSVPTKRRHKKRP